MLALLIVTLLTSGGPHYAKPERISNGFIEIIRGRTTTAVSHSGRLRKRLPPGHYRIVDSAPYINGGAPCEEKHIIIRKNQHLKINLYCNIK